MTIEPFRNRPPEARPALPKADIAIDKSATEVPSPPTAEGLADQFPVPSKIAKGGANPHQHLCMYELPPEGKSIPPQVYGCPAEVKPGHKPEYYNGSAEIEPEHPSVWEEPEEAEYGEEEPAENLPPQMMKCRYELPPEGKSAPPPMMQCSYELPPEGKSNPPGMYQCRYDGPPGSFKL